MLAKIEIIIETAGNDISSAVKSAELYKIKKRTEKKIAKVLTKKQERKAAKKKTRKKSGK